MPSHGADAAAKKSVAKKKVVKTVVRRAAPKFRLTTRPASISVGQGRGQSITLTITRAKGFTGAVQLSGVIGKPGLVIRTLTNPVTAASTVLTIGADATVPFGATFVTIIGSSGAATATVRVGVNVSIKASGVPIVVGAPGAALPAPTPAVVAAIGVAAGATTVPSATTAAGATATSAAGGATTVVATTQPNAATSISIGGTTTSLAGGPSTATSTTTTPVGAPTSTRAPNVSTTTTALGATSTSTTVGPTSTSTSTSTTSTSTTSTVPTNATGELVVARFAAGRALLSSCSPIFLAEGASQLVAVHNSRTKPVELYKISGGVATCQSSGSPAATISPNATVNVGMKTNETYVVRGVDQGDTGFKRLIRVAPLAQGVASGSITIDDTIAVKIVCSFSSNNPNQLSFERTVNATLSSAGPSVVVNNLPPGTVCTFNELDGDNGANATDNFSVSTDNSITVINPRPLGCPAPTSQTALPTAPNQANCWSTALFNN